jgi:hypothetical protein
MAGWAGTKTDMTVDIDGDLEVDEGAFFAQYEEASADLGWLGPHLLDFEFDWKESPADQGAAEAFLFIDTSPNDADWDGWREFRAGEYVTRYYKVRVTFHADAAQAQRPKLLRLERTGTDSDSTPTGPPVEDTLNNPPGAPTAGFRCIVGVGAGDFLDHDGEIATCIESTGPTYRFENPHRGKRVYHIADKEVKVFDEFDEWVSCDARKTAPFSQNQHTNDVESENGGPWALCLDKFQDENAYYENTAGALNGDFITFKIGAKAGNYDLRWLTCTGPNCGSIDIQFDGVVKATFDCHSVGFVRNVKQTQAAIAVLVARTIVVKIVVNGKNPASGGFELYHTRFNLAPA